MTSRPKVFEQDEIESELKRLGVSDSSISPTISFMRLIIPLAVKEVGHKKLKELMAESWPEAPQANWRDEMATAAIRWADAVLERYTADRFGEASE